MEVLKVAKFKRFKIDGESEIKNSIWLNSKPNLLDLHRVVAYGRGASPITVNGEVNGSVRSRQ